MAGNINYDIAKGFQRTNSFPLDNTSVFSRFADAEEYAKGGGRFGKTSYLGQVLAVVENNEIRIYKIGLKKNTNERELQELGGIIDAPIIVDGEVIVQSGVTTNEALQIVVDKLLEKIGSAGIHADDIEPADDDIYVDQAGAGVIIGVRGISNNNVTVLDNRTVKIKFSNGEVLISEPTFLDEVTVGPFPQTTTAGNFWILNATSYEEHPEDNQPGVVRPGNSVTITNLSEAPVGEIEITATEKAL